MNHGLRILLILIMAVVFAGCRQDYSPKPRGHFRIELPEKHYVLFDSVFPYSFYYPRYATMIPDLRPTSEPYWADLSFPLFKGTIHLSYKPVSGEESLDMYFNDARVFVNKHIPKATAIREEVVALDHNRVYGLIYEIRGKEAASPLQFYVTDSVRHFLRGALYFEVTPNNDSLAPVIRFLEEDIRHLLHTLNWK